ncbi:hypothetical protein PoB_002651700 [Plakobranchus ocellatus]|uniref:Uncharacterized protein n=1 Tax=Plakobranchus ocellatus TaxID=259542 RepID=A0AAV3ZZK8_9GAST|nr:hypothetical protein PoB_002651700 [Plakobranchus ocellatus]
MVNGNVNQGGWDMGQRLDIDGQWKCKPRRLGSERGERLDKDGQWKCKPRRAPVVGLKHAIEGSLQIFGRGPLSTEPPTAPMHSPAEGQTRHSLVVPNYRITLSVRIGGTMSCQHALGSISIFSVTSSEFEPRTDVLACELRAGGKNLGRKKEEEGEHDEDEDEQVQEDEDVKERLRRTEKWG